MMSKLIVAMGMALVLGAGSTAVAAPTDAEKCAASLRNCCRKLFAATVKCHAKAATTGTDTTDQACVDTAIGKFDDCGAKALGKGGCLNDAASMEHLKCEIVGATHYPACDVPGREGWADDVKGDTPTVLVP